MLGPRPPGFWTRHAARGFRHLEPGRNYRVIRPFVDFDGVTHPTGEAWKFLGSNFSPHDDGVSLFVSVDGVQEWHIRLQDRPEAQASLIGELASYISEIT